MSKFEFEATVRKKNGSAFARRLRREKARVPGVVYGAGKKVLSISLLHKDILHSLEDKAAFSSVLTLIVDGQEEQVVLKAIQYHSFKPKITHLDFLRIKSKEKITMWLPLYFVGEDNLHLVKGGHKLKKNIFEIEIRCLPVNLPNFIELDISQMTLDQTLRLSDIPLPKGVELANNLDKKNNQPVISLYVPKTKKEEVESDQYQVEEVK